MKIQSITTQLYNTSLSSTKTKRPVFAANSNNTTVAATDNNALIKEQNKILKTGLVLVSAIGVGALALLADKSRGTYRNLSKTYKTTKNVFNSLANDKSIPKLENCKSLNKILREHLQNYINYSKAKSAEIEKAGIAHPDNLLLLSGPPGVGKSYYAKIFAKSVNAEYMEINFADYNSRWAGEDIENLQYLFENIFSISKNSPDKKFVVVFNEIDAAVQSVDKLTSSNMSGHIMSKIEERSTLLTHIENIKEKAPNVVFIGTTNQSTRNGSLDGAILSRFKTIYEIGFPEKEQLYEALKQQLEIMPDGKTFIENNDAKIQELAEKMYNRKCSFRDLNSVIDNSKGSYLNDLLENKDSKYKFLYLEKAFNNIGLTDGEINSAI